MNKCLADVELQESEVKNILGNLTGVQNEVMPDAVYILENDLEKREITLVLPKGCNEITLSEEWVNILIEDLKSQILEWNEP